MGCKMKYTIGLDIGTTNVKGVLLSEESEIVSRASVRFEYDYPQEGYVQIDADRFVDNCITVLSTLANDLPVGGQIAGISQVSASGNLLLLDKDNKPITPIYNWQDQRVTDEMSRILGEDFDYDSYYEKTGWRLGNSFPVAELCFIKCHDPELLEKAATVCMSTEYLNFLLTGKLGISVSAGTPFYLIDQTTRDYDQEMLKILGIADKTLPPVMASGALLGEVTSEMCKQCGITKGAKVYCGTFDHPGGALSTGVTEEGKALLSCGTSWVAFMPIKDRKIITGNRFLCDPFLSEQGGPWAAMCSIASIGNTVNELVKLYIGTESDKYMRLDNYAAASKNGAGGLTIDPQNIRDPEIMKYGKENIAYAILEMPARLLKEKMNVFLSSGVAFDRLVMAGGPTKSDIWVSITERIIGLPITVSNAEYSGAVGAAMIANK